MRLILMFSLLTSLPALAQLPSRRRAQPPPRMEDAVPGREIYNRNCTICHGIDGAAGDRAPALGAQRRYLRRTEGDLHEAIKNGIGGTLMPSSPLPDSDIRKIIAYIRSLRATAIDVAVAGNQRNGEAIFYGKGACLDCHRIRGRGGLTGPDLSDIGVERKLEDIRVALTTEKPAPSRGYQPVRLATSDGRTIEGVIKNENNFSLQILGVDQKLHLLLRDEIQELAYEGNALMPSDFDKKLSKEEFQDLLAFLSRQARRRAQ